MLTAEIIAVGSELLTPFRTDTNSLWLTDRLNSFGVGVKLKTIVGDDDARLEETIRDALKRSGVVVITGGLGPTEDDITRKIAARALSRRLLLDDEVLEEIKAKFLHWGRKMPDINARQAMVIEGAEVLPNPQGTAPGMYVEHDGRVGRRREDRSGLHAVQEPADHDPLQQHRDRSPPHRAGQDRAGGRAAARRTRRPDRGAARPRDLRLPRRDDGGG